MSFHPQIVQWTSAVHEITHTTNILRTLSSTEKHLLALLSFPEVLKTSNRHLKNFCISMHVLFIYLILIVELHSPTDKLR